MIVCFGLALLTGLMGLSTALGAFVGGMVIASARETTWIHTSLESFRVVFVALFFVPIGMLLDLDFLVDQWRLVALLTGLVLVTNTFVNAVVLLAFRASWRDSLRGAALLAQVGELSYVLAAVGKETGFVEDFAYQATVATATLTLILSPPWARFVPALLGGRAASAEDAR